MKCILGKDISNSNLNYRIYNYNSISAKFGGARSTSAPLPQFRQSRITYQLKKIEANSILKLAELKQICFKKSQFYIQLVYKATLSRDENLQGGSEPKEKPYRRTSNIWIFWFLNWITLPRQGAYTHIKEKRRRGDLSNFGLV